MNNLTGQIFGRLTVLARNGSDKYRHVVWTCKCQCGKIKNVPSFRLKNGNTTSCGCYHGEVVYNQNKARRKSYKIINGYKKCSKCHNELSLDNYSKDITKPML